MPEDTRVGIIGGTGLGDSLESELDAGDREVHECSTPFGLPSRPIITGTLDGIRVAILQRHGDGHVLNPSRVPYRANIYALKSLGCTHLIASGATGSLRETIHPGDLVLCDQLIDRTIGRDRTFFETAAVHVEFADPCCPVMRRWLLDAAKSLRGLTVHDEGTYVCIEGPSFSTRAESTMHRQIGADVVGMTALPEARLAREAEMAYALIALPTDYDCWRPRDHPDDDTSLLQEIMGNLQHATTASIELIRTALSNCSILRQTPSPAHDALALAIWSDKTCIDPADVRRLELLCGRYF